MLQFSLKFRSAKLVAITKTDILPGDFQFLLTALQEYAEQFKDDENHYVEPAFEASKLYRKIEKRIPKKQKSSLR